MPARQQTLNNYARTWAEFHEWVERWYSKEDVTLDDFVRHTGWSRRQVQRTFSHYSTTFRDELILVRMRKAAGMLSDSVMYVSSIAHAVGYKQPSQFAKAFRAFSGVNPNQYRYNVEQQRNPS